MSSWKVPLANVNLGPEEIEAVAEFLQSCWLSMGPKTEEFERRFAERSCPSQEPSRSGFDCREC